MSHNTKLPTTIFSISLGSEYIERVTGIFHRCHFSLLTLAEKFCAKGNVFSETVTPYNGRILRSKNFSAKFRRIVANCSKNEMNSTNEYC